MSLFPQKIQNKFTSHLKNVVKTAESISHEFRHKSIGIEHVMFGILSQKGSIGYSILGTEKIDLKTLHMTIDEMPKTKTWKPQLSEDLKSIFKKSVILASRYKHTYIGTEHLLYAIIMSDNKRAIQILSSIGVQAEKLKERLGAIMESSSRFSEIVELLDSPARLTKLNNQTPPTSPTTGNLNNGFMVEMPQINPAAGKQSSLEYFCIDLMKDLESGKADPVVGRSKEVDKLINILNRKSKNNPILVGEPGVGKTAIVQGLAQRIYEGNVPLNLISKRVYSLDLGLLVAGAVFRGEFEARLKDVINEAKDNPDAILFIDEIHTIIGAGSASGSGSLDAANILKPPLSRGEISCIGATTLDEYRKHFKKDAALERRFQMVLVEEPSIQDTKQMLAGLKTRYEKHHSLKISEGAINAAVDLSTRFINGRFLPDKALDVLDEAAAMVRSRHGGINYFKDIKKLEEKKRNLQADKEKAIERERYDEALIVKEKEGILEKSISELFDLQDKESKTKIEVPVTSEDIAEVITQMTGVPVKKMVSDERKKLQELEKKLGQCIIGQEEAIGAISKSIRRSRAGISNLARPIGVFMFLGPTGVGKTELAKLLARIMYEKSNALIKVDMSEFMERHNVSRLVGAPAGYVGYEEGGKLTEQVRLRPYSVILFDEIEKAHPDVFNLLLQIFEDGELTDAAGRKVDFKNTIIIMTSNIGNEQLTEEAALGFSLEQKTGEFEKKNDIRKRYMEAKDAVLKELKEGFSPEFINRIDKVLVFNPLAPEDIKEIVRLQFAELGRRLLRNSGIRICMDRKALDLISQKSFDPNEGARLVRRNLQEMVEDLVSEKVIKEEVKKGDNLILSAKKEDLVIKKK